MTREPVLIHMDGFVLELLRLEPEEYAVHQPSIKGHRLVATVRIPSTDSVHERERTLSMALHEVRRGLLDRELARVNEEYE